MSEGAFSYSLRLYDDAHDEKYGEPFDVPLLLATADSVRPFGSFVSDFDNEPVRVEPWPMTGRRQLCPGTGVGGGLTYGYFKLFWNGDVLEGVNESCPEDGKVGVGRLAKGVSTADRTYLLTREMNYHPDGEQVFFPTSKTPFIALVAAPGDDVRLEDFRALYFDGSCGFKLKTNVWHTAVIPLVQEASYAGKQGKVHGCVMYDSVQETGKFLRVPLKPELAQS